MILNQIATFGLVGFTAAVMHYIAVVFVFIPYGLHPLVANIFGFAVGFQCSYWGHRLFTFQARHLSHKHTLPRFASIALLSFLLNEFLYFLLLRYTSMSPYMALIVVLAVVSLLTFFLGRIWAFKMRNHA